MTSIDLKNFRSFKETGELEIRPLTVFVGKNGSGKSSITRFLPLLRQSAEVRAAAPILWYGSYVDFGTLREVKCKSYKDFPLGISIKFNITDFHSRRRIFFRRPSYEDVKISVELREVDGRTSISRFEMGFSQDNVVLDVNHRHELTNISVREEPNQRKQVPLQFFSHPRRCREFELLVENSSSDGAIYRALINSMAKELGFDYVRNLNVRGGGGDGIAREYELRTDEGPFFCLVDSDRDFPGAPLGGTAAALQHMVRRLGHDVSDPKRLSGWHLLEVREVENLVPYPIIKMIYENEKGMTERVDVLCKIGEAVKDDARRSSLYKFLDIKSGVKYVDLVGPDTERKQLIVELLRIVFTEDQIRKFAEAAEAGYILEPISSVGLRLGEEAPSHRLYRRMAKAIRESAVFDEIMSFLPKLLAFNAADRPMGA